VPDERREVVARALRDFDCNEMVADGFKPNPLWDELSEPEREGYYKLADAAIAAYEQTTEVRERTDLVEREAVVHEICEWLRSGPGDTRFWNESFKAAAVVIEREFGGSRVS
jgi:hypothetical protein